LLFWERRVEKGGKTWRRRKKKSAAMLGLRSQLVFVEDQ